MNTVTWPGPRALKFRQAAFVYLHVTILYEAAAFEMLRAGLLPTRVGPPAAWVVLGGVIGVAVTLGLYYWQHVWLARIVWAFHGLRLPWLIRGAFFSPPTVKFPPGLYITGIVIVVIALWMLARAGWDL